MKLYYKLVFICITWWSSTLIYGQGEPLKVGIDPFYPPFVMQSGQDQFYGFDISMMDTICKTINRDCQYQVVPIADIITAVENRTVDVGVSGITITSGRARQVDFSAPYLISASRFLAKKSWADKPFSIQLLNNRRIGLQKGSIFNDQILQMNLNNVKVTEYTTLTQIIDELNNEHIDFALLDNPSAVFWAIQSSGLLVTVGASLPYGFGMGIAVNRGDDALLANINTALKQYQNSNLFKRDYQKYFGLLLSHNEFSKTAQIG